MARLVSAYRGHCILLCYHGIPDASRDAFNSQMRRLAGHAVCPSLGGADTKGFGRPQAAVTFDDAFANLLTNALPALERNNIPATVFAVVDNLGSTPRWAMPPGHPETDERTMTPEQLMALSKHPLVRIGSHTLTHPDLTRLSPEALHHELAGSKSRLENLLGLPVDDLALPYGACSAEVLRQARQAGYERIYTLDPCPVHVSSNDGIIGRFSMSPGVWPIEFALTCAGAYAWLGPWRHLLRTLRPSKPSPQRPDPCP